MLTLPSLGQSRMRDFWKTMPDSLLPYLSRDIRFEMNDKYDIGQRATGPTSFGDSAVITALNDRYIDVSLSSAVRIQMRLLHLGNGKPLICVARTYGNDRGETRVSFYDAGWNLKAVFCTDSPCKYIKTIPSLTHRPDSMTEDRYAELLTFIDPRMVIAELSPIDDSLTMRLSMPVVGKGEENEMKSILLQRKLNWTGKRFN